MPAGASAGAIRAGKAVVEVGGDISPLEKALARAKSMVMGLGEKLKGLGKFSLFSGGLAATGLVAGYKTVKGLMDEFSDKAKDVKTISSVLGVSTEEASKLAFAFREAGMDADELLHIGTKLQAELVDAAQKGGGVFAELGLDARKLAAEPIDQAMSEIAKSIMDINNPTVRNAAGEQVFGKRWAEVAKMAGDLDEAKQKAEELGFVMSKEMVAKATDAGKAMKGIGFMFESVFMQIGAALVPSTGSLKGFTDYVNIGTTAIRNFLANNEGAVRILGGMGLATVATSASLLVLSKTMGLIGAGASVAFIPFKLALSLVGTLISTLPLLLTPLGLIAVAVGALGAIWMTQTDSGKAFAGQLGGLFQGLGSTAKEAWGGIVDAIKAGDLELAGTIAFKGLEVAWLQCTEFLTKYWNRFKDLFLDGWRDITTEIAKGLATFPSFFSALADVEELLGMNESAALDRNAAQMLKEDPKAVVGQLNQMRAEQQRLSRQARDKDMQDIRDEIARAKAQLGQGVGQARKKAEQMSMEDKIAHEAKRMEDAMRGVQTSMAKGGFDLSRSREEFGVGDEMKNSLILQERNAKAAEAQNGKLEEIKKLILKIGPIFA